LIEEFEDILRGKSSRTRASPDAGDAADRQEALEANAWTRCTGTTAHARTALGHRGRSNQGFWG
jgi:hypothetical protein